MPTQTRGLIFIPDISGFTRFVTEVEIDHSQLIIRELLEILIDANNTNLIVSEVEGDAILFYKFCDKPSLSEVYQQVERMFTAFHKNLMTYERRKYCQCEACLSAINLTLKVVTHYGEFAEYSVKNFNKLIGKDVIVAHQLLKNDINLHEYWIATPQLLHGDALPVETLAWEQGNKSTEQGDISFHFAQLGFLKNQISVEPPAKPDLDARLKVMTFVREYDTDIITLLHATADFTNRDKWMHGVEKVEIQNHFLPRIGNRSIMFVENKGTTMIANFYSFNETRIEFSEMEEESGDLLYYVLEPLGELRTKLTLNYYINKKPFAAIRFNLTKKSALTKKLDKSFDNLAGFVQRLGDTVRARSAPAQA